MAKIQQWDNVFFRKEQLKVGSVLKYYGRHAPGTHWAVTKIWYFNLYKGQYRSYRHETITKLSDAVELKCLKTGALMELSFGYLSYSAIWRL